MRRFVVIGAGLAGHRAAIELRRLDPEATIELVGDEDSLPYDRPPLSKDILLGKVESTILRETESYDEQCINFQSGVRAQSIDRRQRTVALNNGSTLRYDALLIATGSRPRLLPKAIVGRAPVHYLRTIKDACALRDKLADGLRLLVIGGGFIGLEVAAAGVRRGCKVTVIEAGERLLGRGLPAIAARHLHRLHEAEGVRILTGISLRRLAPNGDGVRADTSAGIIEADVVVAGIGALPNVELAEQAGLQIDDGIVVDNRCRTSDPHVFAAGEVTNHPVAIANGNRRLESWKVAQAQPAVAAAAMAGVDCEPYAELPWLWSDQYSCNLQMIGSADQATEFRLRGDPNGESWSLIGLDAEGKPVSGVALNAGRDISVLRRTIARGTPLPTDFFNGAAEFVS